jgi:hypothetical protein
MQTTQWPATRSGIPSARGFAAILGGLALAAALAVGAALAVPANRPAPGAAPVGPVSQTVIGGEHAGAGSALVTKAGRSHVAR